MRFLRRLAPRAPFLRAVVLFFNQRAFSLRQSSLLPLLIFSGAAHYGNELLHFHPLHHTFLSLSPTGKSLCNFQRYSYRYGMAFSVVCFASVSGFLPVSQRSLILAIKVISIHMLRVVLQLTISTLLSGVVDLWWFGLLFCGVGGFVWFGGRALERSVVPQTLSFPVKGSFR